MIHSIVPIELIFRENTAEISYVFENGVLTEKENRQVRRIISTNPSDYLCSLNPSNEKTPIPEISSFASNETKSP